MKRKQNCIRLDPEERLCPEFDSYGVKPFTIPDKEEMSINLVDDFPQEHIQ